MAINQVFKGETTLETATVQTTLNFPDGSVKNASVSSSADHRIAYTKCEGYFSLTKAFEGTPTVDEYFFYIPADAGTIVGGSYRFETLPTSTKTMTLDIKKASDGSASTATMLSSSPTINSGSTASTRAGFSFSSGSYSQYDVIIISIAEGGSGTQLTDLVVTLHFNETPV